MPDCGLFVKATRENHFPFFLCWCLIRGTFVKATRVHHFPFFDVLTGWGGLLVRFRVVFIFNCTWYRLCLQRVGWDLNSITAGSTTRPHSISMSSVDVLSMIARCRVFYSLLVVFVLDTHMHEPIFNESFFFSWGDGHPPFLLMQLFRIRTKTIHVGSRKKCRNAH